MPNYLCFSSTLTGPVILSILWGRKSPADLSQTEEKAQIGDLLLLEDKDTNKSLSELAAQFPAPVFPQDDARTKSSRVDAE